MMFFSPISFFRGFPILSNLFHFNLYEDSWLDLDMELELSFNSSWLLVGSWLFCLQNLPCLVSCRCMFGVRVEVWTKNILYRFNEGQTRFSTTCIAKRLATLHSGHVNYPIFLTTHMQRIPSKLKNVQILKWTINVSIKDIFTFTLKRITFIKNKYDWCSCKICIGVAPIDWNQHPHMRSQYNKHLTS